MRRKCLSIAALAFSLVLVLSGCGIQKPLYSWYNYDDVVYKYSKSHTSEDRENLIKTYEKLINEQRGSRGAVPPGIYAEYGYLLLKEGKQEEGLTLLKKEVALYPESAPFVGRIIKQFEK